MHAHSHIPTCRQSTYLSACILADKDSCTCAYTQTNDLAHIRKCRRISLHVCTHADKCACTHVNVCCHMLHTCKQNLQAHEHMQTSVIACTLTPWHEKQPTPFDKCLTAAAAAVPLLLHSVGQCACLQV